MEEGEMRIANESTMEVEEEDQVNMKEKEEDRLADILRLKSEEEKKSNFYMEEDA